MYDKNFLNELAVIQKASILPAAKGEQEEQKPQMSEQEMGFVPEGFELK